MLSRDSVKIMMRGPVKMVSIPEWGGEVGIRKLSAGDLVKLRSFLKPDDERTPADDLATTCELLSMALCDELGQRMFSVDELREWDGQQVEIMNRLVVATREHNGMGSEAAEDLEKNSESGPTLGST